MPELLSFPNGHANYLPHRPLYQIVTHPADSLAETPFLPDKEADYARIFLNRLLEYIALDVHPPPIELFKTTLLLERIVESALAQVGSESHKCLFATINKLVDRQ